MSSSIKDNNFVKLLQSKNKSVKLFADTILTLKDSQGFYSSLYGEIMYLDDKGLEVLINELSEYNFKDKLDVVMYLEG